MTTPQEIVERGLALSRADGCLVIAEETSNAHLRWANTTLTTNGVTRSRTVTIIATVDSASGTAAGVLSHRGDLREPLQTLVHAAEAAARTGAAAADAEPLVAGGGASTTWEEPAAETSIQVFGPIAPDLAEAFARASTANRRLFGYASHTWRSSYVGSSTGLRLHHDQPTGYVEINAKSADYATSVWAGASSADFSEVNVETLDAGLTERLGWMKRRVTLPPGRYETLLSPAAVADLMLHLYWSAGARDACDGRTVFSRPGGGTRVGERLTEAPLTLRSDPAAPGLRCAPFVVTHASSPIASIFDNGLPLTPTCWINDGKLAALVQTRHSAELTKLPITPMIDNLILEGPPGGGTLAKIVADTARGLLLTCLWYIHEVDPQTLLLTGLTRDGVFLVEGGEVTAAVNNFRFNESPVDLLSRVREIGLTERTLPRQWQDFFARTAMPALRIGDFNMSSVSHAS